MTGEPHLSSLTVSSGHCSTICTLPSSTLPPFHPSTLRVPPSKFQRSGRCRVQAWEQPVPCCTPHAEKSSERLRRCDHERHRGSRTRQFHLTQRPTVTGWHGGVTVVPQSVDESLATPSAGPDEASVVPRSLSLAKNPSTGSQPHLLRRLDVTSRHQLFLSHRKSAHIISSLLPHRTIKSSVVPFSPPAARLCTLPPRLQLQTSD